MKQCRYCLLGYKEADFGVAKTTPGKVYRRRKCRYCYRATKNELKSKRLKWLEAYKKQKGCSKCGTDDPRVLDFHHHNDNKEYNVADGFNNGLSLKVLVKEMRKCIVICANCHRIVHYRTITDRGVVQW